MLVESTNETQTRKRIDTKLCLIGIDDVIPLADLGGVLIASPHPDDESLGCGGLIARCASLHIPVSVLALTNGDASHPGDKDWKHQLGDARKREQRTALKRLGFAHPDVISLDLPDGEVTKHLTSGRQALHQLISDVIGSRNIRAVFVPFIDDEHPDHQATAKLLARVAVAAKIPYFFSYSIWRPQQRVTKVVELETPYSLAISDLVEMKKKAISEHRSQFRENFGGHGNGFTLPEALVREKLEPFEEFYLIDDPNDWAY